MRRLSPLSERIGFQRATLIHKYTSIPAARTTGQWITSCEVYTLAGTSPRRVSMERFCNASELPRDVWVGIAIKVATTSIEDLCRFRMTCCVARDVGDDDNVLRMVAIPPPHEMNWVWIRDPIGRSFFERCIEVGHPELLFREALRELYIRRNRPVGWEMLQKAARNGLDAARYAVSMELLLRRDDRDAQKEGLELFRTLEAGNLLPACYSSCFAVLTISWPDEVQMPDKGEEHTVCDSTKCMTRGHMGLLYEYRQRAAEQGSIHGVGGANHVGCIRCRADYEVERFVDIARV
ncbi:uncharacterized protein LOC130934117 [Arachis stenosperma]|uniref:uncharacterized protein LOC130934117 n=1 Tax=Arachis stenosperma TaxID=217475 RepID=UPI0025ABEA4C|nr:uncharacterized protein LOC130934117 [Arachis stenosperma]